MEFAADNLTPIAQVPVPCNSSYPFYPGTGTSIAIVCLTNREYSVLLFDWKSLQITGTVSSSVLLQENLRGFTGFTFDLANARMFESTSMLGGPAYLLTIDMENGGIVANVSLPAGAAPTISTDGTGTGIDVMELGNSTLYEVDWASGLVTHTVEINGVIGTWFENSLTGRLYVSVAPSRQVGFPAHLLSFTADGLVQGPSAGALGSAYDTFTEDSVHGDLYVSTQGGYFSSTAFNESSGHQSATLAPSPASTFSALDSVYDASTDTLAVAGFLWLGSGDQAHWSPGLLFLELTHGLTPQPSFSAFPWVGASLPLDIGVLGVIIGISLLTSAVVVRKFRSWKEYR